MLKPIRLPLNASLRTAVEECYGRSGEEICWVYAMAASGRMQCDYKQTVVEVIYAFLCKAPVTIV